MNIDQAAKNVLLGKMCDNCYYCIHEERCDNSDNVPNHGPDNETCPIPEERTCQYWKENDRTQVLSQDEIDQLLAAISSTKKADKMISIEKKEQPAEKLTVKKNNKVLSQEELDELLHAIASAGVLGSQGS